MLTITQAAADLGMHPRTVRHLCKVNGIGERINPRLYLVSKSDVAKLRKLKRPRGRPVKPSRKPKAA